jgi:hypothetical protein
MEKAKEVYMYVLGGLVVLGFFGVVIFKLMQGLDVQLEVGALLGSFGTVVGYFYGSSKSSSDKTKLLSEQK